MDGPAAAKRGYRMRARAATSEATRSRIVAAAFELFSRAPYDRVSLEDVASRAEVSLPTVLRKFESKDALFLACARTQHDREARAREVAPGDVRGVVRLLAARYEYLSPMWGHYIGLEERFPAVAHVIAEARQGHHAWLDMAFAPWIAARDGARRRRQLAALFAATEIYVWWSWRNHLGLERAEAERTMLELLQSLVARWAGKEQGAST